MFINFNIKLYAPAKAGETPKSRSGVASQEVKTKRYNIKGSF